MNDLAVATVARPWTRWPGPLRPICDQMGYVFPGMGGVRGRPTHQI